MAGKEKDTIYIDIDDEITGIIDKVQASDANLIALVLPKRAAVFQSIVNMKLLKRAADSSKKGIVLITSEPGLLPLAGAAGVYVAKSLTSKPAIPIGPQLDDDDEEAVDEDTPLAEEESEEEITAETDGDKPVGELAGATAAGALVGSKLAQDDEVETLEFDNQDLPSAGDANSGGPVSPKTFEPPTTKNTKPKKDKKLKVPDFNRFRLFLILGILLFILLVVGVIWAIKYAPKAVIKVNTNAVNVDVSAPVILSTAAKKFDPETGTVPAKSQQLQKTYTQTVPTTGQKNTGNKASGTVTMSAGSCSGTIPAGVSAGSGISNNNQTYITTDSISFTPVVVGGKCIFQGVNANGGNSVGITAQNGGAGYNVSGVSFSVAGRGDVSANGSASGGTDNIVQSINQNDINNAKAKINLDDAGVKKTLQNDLKKDDWYPVIETFNSGTPVVNASGKVGDTVNTVTVTETVTYTMFGAHENDLKAIIDSNVKSQIDTSKQTILNNGLSKATFNIESATPTTANTTMNATATVGPDIDTIGIRDNAVGKKPGDIKQDLEGQPGIKTVDVHLSPFWVSSVPKETKRVTVIIAKPTANAKSSSDATNP